MIDLQEIIDSVFQADNSATVVVDGPVTEKVATPEDLLKLADELDKLAGWYTWQGTTKELERAKRGLTAAANKAKELKLTEQKMIQDAKNRQHARRLRLGMINENSIVPKVLIGGGLLGTGYMLNDRK